MPVLPHAGVGAELEGRHLLQIEAVHLIVGAILSGSSSLLIPREHERTGTGGDVGAAAIDGVLCEAVGVAVEVEVKPTGLESSGEILGINVVSRVMPYLVTL